MISADALTISNAPKVPHIRTFHARHGRLSLRRRELLELVIPRLDVINQSSPLDLRIALKRDFVVVDFGCGMGDHTQAMLENQPDWAVLAIDVHTAGICDVAEVIDSGEYTNALVHLGDGITVLEDQLADQSVSEVHILFPDPWPKAKHQKRRVIQDDLLAIIYRILVPSGTIRIATDHDGYALHVQQVFSQRQDFELSAGGFEVPDTSYHRRAIRLGHTIHSFSARKISD